MKRSFFIFWLPFVILLLVGYFVGQSIFNPMFSSYLVQIMGEQGELLADGQKVFYSDVNNDGSSEEFIYYHLSDNRQPVINQYSADGKFQNLWSLDGEVFDQFEFIVGDYDGDKQKELYVFALEKNNLFLYGIKPNHSNVFIFDKVLVCSFENNESNRFVKVHAGGVADMNNDGFGEVVFSLNSRYFPTPRRVVSYNIKNGILSQSRDFGMQLVGNPIVYDIDGDNFPEVFLATLNSTNQAWKTPNETALYSASLILDHQLQEKFTPIQFKNRMSVTASYPLKMKGENQVLSLSWPLKRDEEGKVTLISAQGDTVASRKVKDKTFVFDPLRNDWSRCLAFTHDGEVLQLDEKLNFKVIANLNRKINQIEFIDINSDNKQEIVVMLDNELAIFDNEFKHLALVDFPGMGIEDIHLSVKSKFNSPNHLSIQNGNYQYLVKYKKNKNYSYRFLIFLLGGILFAAVYYFARRIYLHQIDRIKQSNKEVMELQIELMKNQLDPHFLFNALNSISYSINKNDRKTAYSNLGIFSKLMRESISSMDELNRTLEEEINYTTHYLLLEKFRFKEQFDYNFMVSPEVSKSTMVPKMCLFCYVESALKKGVLPKEAGGKIEVKIDCEANGGLILSIGDNGLHRSVERQQKTISNSIVALNHIIEYYNSFNTKGIDVKYRDLGSVDEPNGSLITLHIPQDYQYRM